MKICKKCGQENPDHAKFCGNCGTMLDEETSVRAVKIDVKPNNFVKVSTIFAIIASVITIFASTIALCVVGLTLSVISICILAYAYLKDKMKGVYRLGLFLNIYSFLGNFIWLAYHLWIAPGL